MTIKESPLDAICRRACERRAYILAHPDEFTREQVQQAKLDQYQSERLSLASTLRYDD
jgi:hypothetical protein